MSYVQLFPTHMLSLESVLGFCHRIAKGGDCKVEFNQPSCWLYSVPTSLLVREREELLKFVQKGRDSWLDLASGSQLQDTRMMHTC